MSDAEQWRGVKAEDAEEDEAALSAFLGARTRRLIASLLAPHARSLRLLLVAIVGSTGASMVGPYLVGLAVDRAIPAVRVNDYAPLVAITVAMVLAALVQSLLLRVFLEGSGRIGQDVLFELRRRVFGHLQLLSVAFHERYSAGKAISRLTSDLDALNDVLETGLAQLLTAVLSIVAVGTIVLVLDAPLGAVALASFVPLFALSRWYQRRSRVAYRATRSSAALVIVQFTESLRGIRAVQSFRREGRNDEIFGRLDEDWRAANTRSSQLLSVFWPGIVSIGNVTTAAVLLYGATRVIDHEMAVGVLASFLLYLRRFFEPVADVTQFYDSWQSAASGLEKLAGVLDEEPSVASPAVPSAPPASGWRGAVSFEGVEFSYRDGSPVLSGLDLEIPAGQTVALLGRTGAGKSTIARLLARLYDPTGGSVAIDGVRLGLLSEQDLREAVAMVSQESFLFSGSLADNLAFGRPGASRAEIVEAARALGADRFIAGLEGGYDADVGKQGARLSSGQRQLVALVRAMLADPAVLILDEASSSLDAPSERAVQAALRRVLAGRSALIIAHRLSTVEIADRVLVLDGGRIVEDGAPAELLAAGLGEYASLHEAWRESLG